MITKLESHFTIPTYNGGDIIQIAARREPAIREAAPVAPIPAVARAEAPTPGATATMPRYEQILATRLRKPADWSHMAFTQGRGFDGMAAKAVMTETEMSDFEQFGMSLEQFNAALERAYAVTSEQRIRKWLGDDEWKGFLTNATSAEVVRAKDGKMSPAEVLSISDKESLDGQAFKARALPLVPSSEDEMERTQTLSLAAIAARFNRANRDSDYMAAKTKMSQDELEDASKNGITLDAFAKKLQAAYEPVKPAEAKELEGEGYLADGVGLMTRDERARFEAGRMSLAELTYILELPTNAKTHDRFVESRQMP